MLAIALVAAYIPARRAAGGGPDGSAPPRIATLLLGDYRVGQLADTFDFDDALVAGLQVTRRLAGETDAGRGAGGDDVAGLQREHAREIRDQLRHVEDQVLRVRVLQLFAARGSGEIVEIVRILDLVGGHDRRAHRAKVSKVLPIIHWLVAIWKSRALTSFRMV